MGAEGRRGRRARRAGLVLNHDGSRLQKTREWSAVDISAAEDRARDQALGQHFDAVFSHEVGVRWDVQGAQDGAADGRIGARGHERRALVPCTALASRAALRAAIHVGFAPARSRLRFCPCPNFSQVVHRQLVAARAVCVAGMPACRNGPAGERAHLADVLTPRPEPTHPRMGEPKPTRHPPKPWKTSRANRPLLELMGGLFRKDTKSRAGFFLLFCCSAFW